MNVAKALKSQIIFCVKPILDYAAYAQVISDFDCESKDMLEGDDIVSVRFLEN